MWVQSLAHIIGDHLGLNLKFLASQASDIQCHLVSFMLCNPCTDFRMYVLENSHHSRSLIALSCLEILRKQGRDSTKAHQTYLENQVSVILNHHHHPRS